MSRPVLLRGSPLDRYLEELRGDFGVDVGASSVDEGPRSRREKEGAGESSTAAQGGDGATEPRWPHFVPTVDLRAALADVDRACAAMGPGGPRIGASFGLGGGPRPRCGRAAALGAIRTSVCVLAAASAAMVATCNSVVHMSAAIALAAFAAGAEAMLRPLLVADEAAIQWRRLSRARQRTLVRVVGFPAAASAVRTAPWLAGAPAA